MQLDMQLHDRENALKGITIAILLECAIALVMLIAWGVLA